MLATHSLFAFEWMADELINVNDLEDKLFHEVCLVPHN